MGNTFQIYNKHLQVLKVDGAPANPSNTVLDLQSGIFNRVNSALRQSVQWIEWVYNTKWELAGMKILDNPEILTRARGIVHTEGDWHIAAHYWAFTIEKEGDKNIARLAVQLRGAGKDIHGDTYDASAAWHIDHEGDPAKWKSRDFSTVDTIRREAEEEVGLNITIDDLKFVGIETYAMTVKKDGKVINQNNEHKFVYFHELPPGSLTRNEETRQYSWPLFKIDNGDQSDQLDSGKELTPEVAGVEIFTLEELESELKKEEVRIANGEKEKFMPPLNYWHRVIAEIRKEMEKR